MKKFLRIQPFTIVFVDVSATASAFVGSSEPTKAAAVAETSTKTMNIKVAF